MQWWTSKNGVKISSITCAFTQFASIRCVCISLTPNFIFIMQVVSMDLYNRIWECKDRDSNYVCPGQLNTLCPEDEFTVQCECAGELWMVPDCQEVNHITQFFWKKSGKGKVKTNFITALHLWCCHGQQCIHRREVHLSWRWYGCSWHC